MKKYIVLNSNGAAFQAGVMTKTGQNPDMFIGSLSKFKWATKFNSVDEAIAKIESTGKMKKYRVVAAENPTQIFAENGIKKEFSQLLPFSIFK